MQVFLFLPRFVHGDCGRCVCWGAPYSSVNHCALAAFAVVVLVSALLAAGFSSALREKLPSPRFVDSLSWCLVLEVVMVLHTVIPSREIFCCGVKITACCQEVFKFNW